MRAAESLEGGVNRNSSPQSIDVARTTYDRFLAKFPLFFGYWKKYADLEFGIDGTESAEIVSYPSADRTFFTNFCQDLRTRCWKHRRLCRSLDQLLHLQNGNQPQPGCQARVSRYITLPFLTVTQSSKAKFAIFWFESAL